MKRGGPLRRRAPLRTYPAKRPQWTHVRGMVLARSGGACDLCGQALGTDYECHHRLLRKQGGRDDLATCVALHGECHRWVHGHPMKAKARGFIVPGWFEDPAHWPVYIHSLGWVVPVGLGWATAEPNDLQITWEGES